MKRLIGAALAALTLACAPAVAHADTTTSFNGCVYHTQTYLQAVELWEAAGYPDCGVIYSVSVDTTVSGTVGDDEQPPSADRSSWG